MRDLREVFPVYYAADRAARRRRAVREVLLVGGVIAYVILAWYLT